MEKVTELTYENMKEYVESYFSTLPLIKGFKDADKFREFFSPDAKVMLKFNPEMVATLDREQWVQAECSFADFFGPFVSSDAPHEGMIIDVKNGRVAFLFEESLKHPWGEAIKPPMRFGFKPREYRIGIFELCVHDNKVKAKSETILQPRYEPF